MRVTTGQYAGALPAHALCCFRFSSKSAIDPDTRVVPVAMTSLTPQVDCEIWLGQSTVQCGTQDGIRYAHDGETLAASLVLSAEQCVDLERVTQLSYMRMDVLMRRMGYPHWHRMWNYLGRINEGVGDAERYRRFNSGRYAAVALRNEVRDNLPAASGVGANDSNLVLACIAGRRRAQQIENPRQLSAFCYPRQYGPRAPLFSRAALVPNAGGAQLLISGTASIVGHESRHPQDVAAQLDETLVNLQALLTQTHCLHENGAGPDLAQLESLKVYLRNRSDHAQVARQLARWAQPQQPTLFLHAEICRRELLLEIEATYQLPALA